MPVVKVQGAARFELAQTQIVGEIDAYRQKGIDLITGDLQVAYNPIKKSPLSVGVGVNALYLKGGPSQAIGYVSVGYSPR